MNKLKIFSVALVLFGAGTYAQDINQANKAIDAEQYEKAKTILKSLVASKPDEGKNFFILGNLYLTQKYQDSAKMNFDKGLVAKNGMQFNYIGLGQIELENGNKAAASTNFDKAIANVKKKDFEEYLYIGKAYMNPVNPDYKKALENLNKAKLAAPMNAMVSLYLGDAFVGDKNVNEAYSAYRNAYDADKTLLRAKLQLGVITKGSKAFTEAEAEFNKILAENPNYGLAYRELAETYYLRALNEKDQTKYPELNKKAIEYYEKYMTLTDYSLDSRMRHADFLILTKDYKALEAEATAMQKLSKVNPRILRYLGYSAYQNGNSDAAIKALDEFFAKDKAKIIGRDYLYLGLAKTQKALTLTTGADGKPSGTVDKALYDLGIADIRKGVELDPTMANELNDFGKKFFDLKLYKEAAGIYEIATTNPNSRNFLYDNFYLGYALYYDNAYKAEGEAVDAVALNKALVAFDNVIKDRPKQQDAYLYKARVNSLMQTDAVAQENMVKSYEDYVRVVTDKGPEEVAKPENKKKFIEAYNNIAIHYLKTDKVKAKENLDKVLALDPANEDALANMKFVK
ncbi:tetratricopeptide repeat protein [Flavobacterium sp. 3HN19-14]|uniref:tetratricopeptide repeat protein n=1 Tax=Flavobacterium sp. 3HN19-14 TaxID=3448133 RepID=UPI003EDE8FF5